MTATDDIRPIDQGRAARLLLSILDDELGRAGAVLIEANRDDAVHLLIAVLARNLLTISIGTAGEDGTRRALERSILDAHDAHADDSANS